MPAPKGHPAYNVNGEGGRPKIYTKEFIDKEADILEEWLQDKPNNIFIEDFCLERNYHDSRIPEFVSVNKRFSAVYDMLKMKQRISLFKGGLNRKFAHPMCALVLSNYHNIHAKTETTVTNNNVDTLDCVIDEIDGNTKDLINE
jgi:hypothetical protein